MEQVTKLVEQYAQSQTFATIEKEALLLIIEGLENSNDSHFLLRFLIWIASHPTCTENERKFLDRIRELAKYEEDEEFGEDYDCIYLGDKSGFTAIDFPGVNLKELVDGK